MRITLAASLFACICIGTIFSTTPASAFGMTGLGGSVGYVSPENLDGAMIVGGHMEFVGGESPLRFIPSLMYWNTNHVSDFSANADLSYDFGGDRMTPYVGAGLGINLFSNDVSDQSDTKVGANFFGGLRLPASGHHYFLEGRNSAAEISQFALLGGITFHGWGGR
jgi:opacity protein-like surface antigen